MDGMVADWVKMCRADDLSIDGSHVDIRFGDERRQRVTVEDDGAVWR